MLKGVVKNLTDYGAFVDLGGIDGLLHITDMAWKRVHPSEVVEVGQELDVRVLKYDRERNRVSLGLKQLGEDPWDNIARRYPANSRVFGKVSNVTDYGAFVEIEPGVEGLVHVSEMDWTNKNVNPSKVVQVGDDVEVMVLDVDEERRRISLGMKQVTSNPWETFAAIHKKGDKVSGQIKSITDFGIFIGLDGGIDGLIHLSDISWNSTGEDVARNFKKGDTLEAVVLAVDPGARAHQPRRQATRAGPDGPVRGEQRPRFDRQGHGEGKSTPKGATIDLGDGVEGYVSARDISHERVDDASQVLKVGQEVEAKVIGNDRKGRTMQLSIKAKDGRNPGSAGAVQQGLQRCLLGHHPTGRAAANSWKASPSNRFAPAAARRAGSPQRAAPTRNPMTKSELIEILSQRQVHLKADDVDLAVKSLLEMMGGALAEGERIEVRVRQLLAAFPSAAHGRNPKTGDAVTPSGKRSALQSRARNCASRVAAWSRWTRTAETIRRAPADSGRINWRHCGG